MNSTRWIVLGAVVAVLGLGVGWFWSTVEPTPVSGPAGAAPAADVPHSDTVATGAAHYSVTGDGPAVKIRYSIVDDEVFRRDMPLPWIKSTGATWMAVEAQRGPGPGSITCQITGHGQVWATHTASGPYAVCTASGVPEKPHPDPAPRELPRLCPTCITPGRPS
jgi:hypothetical protein